MSVRKRSNQSGTSGTSGQRPKCFRDILNVVLRLSDEEWKAVSRNMPREVSRLEFAAACTKIVTSVSSAVVRRLLKPLSKSFGIKTIVEANDRLKNMESNSDASDASDVSAESVQASDFICRLGQRIVNEIKGAMLEAIRRTASQARPSKAAMTQLEDISVACTNEICEKILALYRSEELERPRKEKRSETLLKSPQEVQGIMKSLEQVVSISRSSSSCSVTSASDSVLTAAEVTASDCLSSTARTERPFSDQFMSKASQVISGVLLKTEQKLASALSARTSGSVCSETEPKFMTELAESTAAEILQKLFYVLVQSLREHLSGVSRNSAEQSGAEREEKFLSDAQKIHTDIHKQVFRFFRKRQQAVSEKSETLLGVGPEASAELDVSLKNLQEPGAAENILERATRVASDVLVRRLNSRISMGSVTTPPSKVSLDLDQVVSDKVKKFLGEEAPQIRETDMGTGSDAGLSDEKSERKPAVQGSLFTPLHLLTVVRNQMKAFVLSFKRSANNEKTSLENAASSAPKQTGRQIGRSFSDSVLEHRRRTLHTIQFPSELIYTFVEESTRGLLQNVLNTSASDNGISRTAKDQQENKTSEARYVVAVKTQKNKQSSVASSDGDEPNTRTTQNSSDRRLEASPSVFGNARRTLEKFFSVSQTTARPSPESQL